MAHENLYGDAVFPEDIWKEFILPGVKKLQEYHLSLTTKTLRRLMISLITSHITCISRFYIVDRASGKISGHKTTRMTGSDYPTTYCPLPLPLLSDSRWFISSGFKYIKILCIADGSQFTKLFYATTTHAKVHELLRGLPILEELTIAIGHILPLSVIPPSVISAQKGSNNQYEILKLPTLKKLLLIARVYSSEFPTSFPMQFVPMPNLEYLSIPNILEYTQQMERTAYQDHLKFGINYGRLLKPGQFPNLKHFESHQTMSEADINQLPLYTNLQVLSISLACFHQCRVTADRVTRLIKVINEELPKECRLRFLASFNIHPESAEYHILTHINKSVDDILLIERRHTRGIFPAVEMKPGNIAILARMATRKFAYSTSFPAIHGQCQLQLSSTLTDLSLEFLSIGSNQSPIVMILPKLKRLFLDSCSVYVTEPADSLYSTVPRTSAIAITADTANNQLWFPELESVTILNIATLPSPYYLIRYLNQCRKIKSLRISDTLLDMFKPNIKGCEDGGDSTGGSNKKKKKKKKENKPPFLKLTVELSNSLTGDNKLPSVRWDELPLARLLKLKIVTDTRFITAEVLQKPLTYSEAWYQIQQDFLNFIRKAIGCVHTISISTYCQYITLGQLFKLAYETPGWNQKIMVTGAQLEYYKFTSFNRILVYPLKPWGTITGSSVYYG
jgi:hypothetical protein